MKNIILASTSPRRKELLSITGLPFTVEGSTYEEDMTLNLKPDELAKHLSYGKALVVANKHKNVIVIGADTFVVSIDNIIFGKPYSEDRAREILRLLSGKQHTIITGYTIIDSDTQQFVNRSVTTKILMKKLTDKIINSYIKTGEPLDKAGAYALQQKGGC